MSLCLLMIATLFTACRSSSETEVEPTPTPETESEVIPDEYDTELDEYDTMDLSLEDFRDKMKEVYGDDYIPDRTLMEDEIEEKLGLTSDMYEEILVEVPTLDENPDIFAVIKTDDPQAVEEKLQEYKENLLANTKYEANIEKITATEITTNGDYVFMHMLGANDFGEDVEDMAESFKEEIQKGTDAIKEMF